VRSWSLVKLNLAVLLQPIAISILAFTLGYSARALFAPVSTNSATTSKRSLSSSTKVDGRRSSPISSDSDSRSDAGASDSDSDAEDEAAALVSNIASVKASLTEEVKLVLVVNDELKMSKGKIAAQAGHATLACALMLKDINPKVSLTVIQWRFMARN
jgi:PTH2 family peptidyl-tRNA hydrolase